MGEYMRQWQKDELISILQTIQKAHEEIRKYVKNGNEVLACKLVEECQDCAIQVGNIIEDIEKNSIGTIKSIEEYCEYLYDLYNLLDGREAGKTKNIFNILDAKISDVLQNIRSTKIKREVVFMPYKASMWDSMDSVWNQAMEDEDNEVFVIPIPYFERNSDFSFGKVYYEGNDFPEYVTVTKWNEYDLQVHRPDIIFIHNPYDQCNTITSVMPQFYSSELIKYAGTLVYVPYFLFPGKIEKHLIDVPGVLYADYICVQNEAVKNKYIEVLQERTNASIESIRNILLPLGTPKTDMLIKYRDEYAKQKSELTNKKIVFLNTNVSLILNNSYEFINNMHRIFNKFREYRDEYYVIWREHPLSESTIRSMRPEMLQDYVLLKREFEEQRLGMIDKHPNPYYAMCISDCYFGSGGSLIPIYGILGNPMMITAYKFPEGISKEETTLQDFITSSCKRPYYNELNSNSLDIFLTYLDELKQYSVKNIEIIKEITNNIDGTVGRKLYKTIIERIGEQKHE